MTRSMLCAKRARRALNSPALREPRLRKCRAFGPMWRSGRPGPIPSRKVTVLLLCSVAVRAHSRAAARMTAARDALLGEKPRERSPTPTPRRPQGGCRPASGRSAVRALPAPTPPAALLRVDAEEGGGWGAGARARPPCPSEPLPRALPRPSQRTRSHVKGLAPNCAYAAATGQRRGTAASPLCAHLAQCEETRGSGGREGREGGWPPPEGGGELGYSDIPDGTASAGWWAPVRCRGLSETAVQARETRAPRGA